jgi:hypothetical protein
MPAHAGILLPSRVASQLLCVAIMDDQQAPRPPDAPMGNQDDPIRDVWVISPLDFGYVFIGHVLYLFLRSVAYGALFWLVAEEVFQKIQRPIAVPVLGLGMVLQVVWVGLWAMLIWQVARMIAGLYG